MVQPLIPENKKRKETVDSWKIHVPANVFRAGEFAGETGPPSRETGAHFAAPNSSVSTSGSTVVGFSLSLGICIAN